MNEEKTNNLEKLMDDIELHAESLNPNNPEDGEILHELANRYMKINAEYFVLTGKLYRVDGKA